MISVPDMVSLEQEAVKHGTPLIELMERAGCGAAELIKEEAKDKRVVIFCGHGNNGGDGMVIARRLASYAHVTVYFVSDEQKMTELTSTNKGRLPREVRYTTTLPEEGFDICIDAMLGTGVSGSIRNPFRLAITQFNSLEGKKVCIDVPSGINPDTGACSDVYCNCDMLICFHDIKQGLESYEAITHIVDIGLKR